MTLLDSIAEKTLRADVFRMAGQWQATEFLRVAGFDDESVREMLQLLSSSGISDTPQDLLDDPFRPKTQLRKAGYRTRFSDGSFPVFYSSLEPVTAEAEVKYWFIHNVAGPAKPRVAYYSRFSCRFDGSVKDIRPALVDWPDLTHDNDYSLCNRVGAEATTSGLDGLMTPSARRAGGTNIPVFTQRALSNPVIHGLVALTLDPSSGAVDVKEAASKGT